MARALGEAKGDTLGPEDGLYRQTRHSVQFLLKKDLSIAKAVT
jgi:hypothetical protein